jgi:regulator of PEP synthase PpsR (kinase-PPPase family)
MVGVMEGVKKIIVVSDGTGRTAKRLVDAVLSQYVGHESKFCVEGIHSSIRTVRALDSVVDSVTGDCLIIFSIVQSDLRKHLHMRLHEAGILHLNVLEPMLKTMAKFLGFHPDYKPGLLQLVDDKYYKKIDAIGFTVEHDDGLGHQIEEADLVIVGPSRTCKTPISMYLACNHGMKVANIPVFPEDGSTKRLLLRLEKVEHHRIFGVTMRADVLAQIREVRSELLGGRRVPKELLGNYHDPGQVEKEIEYFGQLCYKQAWEVINVTRRAIEEISSEILNSLEESFEELID